MARRKRSRKRSNQRWDVQTSGRLLLALNESVGTNPTPQQIIDAVGVTLNLDACGIFPTRGEEDASIAVYFRTDPLRDAFIQAYTEKTVGVHTIRRMSMDGVATTIEDWEGTPLLPSYLEDLLNPDTWSTAIQLFYEEEVVGLLWMIGSPDQQSKPPSKEILHSIAQLATLAFQQTVGRAWALSDNDELHLLEEMNAILTQQRPFVERLQAVVERAQEASGFTSVGLATRGAATANGSNAAAMAVHESAYSKEYLNWAVEHFATDEALDESQRFFQGREGPLLFANPAQLATVEEESKRWLLQNDVRFFVQIPLRYGDQYLGTLRICSTFSETETWERLRVFTALASHIAAILKSVRLFDEVQEAHARLTKSHHATLRTLAYAAEARDPFTGDHLRNIEVYTRALGGTLALPPEDVEALRFGAILHDVGKLRVPDAILLKPGKLDEDEWTIIRQHPLYGEEILVHSDIPPVALQIARWHHERWDGGGYPDGISGDEIPLAVQIVTVADVFDALTSTRPYKHAWSADQALDEIEAHRGRQFSPRVVDAFHALSNDGAIREILAHQVASPVAYPAKRRAA